MSPVSGRGRLDGGRIAMNMESTNFETVIGRQCRLLKPVRDHEGLSRFSEKPRILRAVDNLGRRMLLVQFDDGATTFLFPDEVVVE
jgi:hypothetical protein